MKIVIRGGHSPRCKGAIGKLDEQICVHNMAKQLGERLRKAGHTVYLVESNERDVNSDLRLGVNKANSVKADLFISVHMNASNGKGNGTEAWVYNKTGSALAIGERFCSNYAKLGFSNRGVKASQSLYELKATSCKSIILETMFCDNQKDFDLWKKNRLADLVGSIANAIDTKIPIKEQVKYRVLCYGMTSEDRAKEAVNILKKYGNFNASYESYTN